MAQRHFYRNDDGDMEEVVGATLIDSTTLSEKAEEGAVAQPSIVVDDPAMTRKFVGHRRWVTYEDESEDANQVLFSGFVWNQSISRGWDTDLAQPLGRVWSLTLVDMNTLWSNRVLVGSDCKRPAETDVERMQWLVDTSEMGYFDDLTLLSTASPVNMPKNDYRQQMVQQVADDCSQQSGKNWWIGATGAIVDGVGTYSNFVWYGRDSLTSYTSPLALSNTLADLAEDELRDGSSLVWPVGDDAKLDRDPSRQFSGGLLQWAKGAVYRVRKASLAAFSLSGRDGVFPHPNVKTKAQAISRLLRVLEEVSVQDERITCSTIVPAGKASMIRTGMRIQYRSDFMPGYDAWRYLRVLEATPKQQDAGSRYRLGLVLQGPGEEAPVPLTCSAALAAMFSDVNEGLESARPATVTSTVTDDGYLVGILIAENGNTPDATAMGTPSGYTTLDARDFSRATWHIGYKAASAGSHTMTADHTPGFSTNGVWLAMQAWLPWQSVTVVQETDPAGSGPLPGTFDADPTPGNTILMFAICESGTLTPGGGSYGPSTGWTQLFADTHSNSNSALSVACWARCVQEGDGRIYEWTGGSSVLMGLTSYVVEIATS